jgi:hypothetical protein
VMVKRWLGFPEDRMEEWRGGAAGRPKVNGRLGDRVGLKWREMGEDGKD